MNCQEKERRMILLVFVSCAISVCCVSSSKSENFDYYVFSQQWPQSSCIGVNISHEGHHCAIAANVSTWTIHGLWPTKAHESPPGPNCCNNSDKFDVNAIKPLLANLLEYWPNLYVDTTEASFWKHEWTKHGTCAVGTGSIKTEYDYFNTGLSLNRKFDLFGLLKEHNIIPSDTVNYQYTDVLQVFQNYVPGGKVTLQCYYDKKMKTQYLAQIEICVSKDFKLQGCSSSESRPRKSLLAYHKDCVTDRELGHDFHERNSVFQFDLDADLKSYHWALGGPEPCYDTEDLRYPVIRHNA